MKIVVDDKGWVAVEEPSDSAEVTTKTTSGVYAKTTPTEDPAQAPTEPSPPTEQAIISGEMAFPPPGTLPTDLVALARDPKVA
jgi:hypothetical protein